MGYRSDVQSIIYPTADNPELLEVFNTLIAKEKLAGEQGVFGLFKDDCLELKESSIRRSRRVGENEDGSGKYEYDDLEFPYLELVGDDWKWYDDYEDVQYWHKLLEEAEQLGLNYEFVRIGEERDDVVVEHGGDCEYFLDVSRSIVSSI